MKLKNRELYEGNSRNEFFSGLKEEKLNFEQNTMEHFQVFLCEPDTK